MLGVGGVAGIQGWRIYENVQSERASALYEQMLASASAADTEGLKQSAEALLVDHPNSGYADLAQLMLARQALEAGDPSAAQGALENILENSPDPVMQQVARVRLAVLALQAGDVERIKTLAESDSTDGFVSQFQELLGDATMITVKVGNALVSVKADKNFRASIGEKINISVPAGICHLFDTQTGARIGG